MPTIAHHVPDQSNITLTKLLHIATRRLHSRNHLLTSPFSSLKILETRFLSQLKVNSLPSLIPMTQISCLGDSLPPYLIPPYAAKLLLVGVRWNWVFGAGCRDGFSFLRCWFGVFSPLRSLKPHAHLKSRTKVSKSDCG